MIDLRWLTDRWRPTSTVGCDWGGTTLKFVHLGRVGEQLQLKNCDCIEVDWNNTPVSFPIVRKFLADKNVPINKVVLNLSDTSLVTRRMEVAKMPSSDLRLAIQWNFRDGIETRMEDLQVAYTEIKKSDEGGRRLLMCYGIDRSIVDSNIARANDLGLGLARLEPNISALSAIFAHNIESKKGKHYAMIDLGFSYGHFIVMNEGKLVYARSLDEVRLEQLARSLTSTTASPEECWKALHRISSDEESRSVRDQEMMGNFFSKWVVEVQRSIDTYVSDWDLDVAESDWEIFICGGGALVPGIAQTTQTNLGISAKVFDPFSKILGSDGTPAKVPNAPLYTVATGLAIPTK